MPLDPQDQFNQWLEGLDPNQPVSELIDPAWLEDPNLAPDELSYLEEQGLIAAPLPPLDFFEQVYNKDPEWLEVDLAVTLEELAYLEEQGREYAQELLDQGLITATLPPLDIPEHFLEQVHDKESDFGR